MAIEIQCRIINTITKDIWLDLDDRLRAEALKAYEMVKQHSGLDGKRARALEGQARFRMMEKGFQEICELHGGFLLDGGVIPNSDLRVFQPFMRFENSGEGVILGMAAMPDPKTLPVKNKSRLAGVSLNYDLIPRLDFDGNGPKAGDIFVLFLVARNRDQSGKIVEVAVGLIDSNYEAFLYYEPLKTVLAAYTGGAAADDPETTVRPVDKKAGVSLKSNILPFVPPESPDERDEKNTSD